ncbi:hypothetical protein Q7P37_005576 [Cladosporium fusiforme]
MPTLGHLSCNILLPPTDTPLPTYKHKYLDSSVSAYVPVPNIPILHAAPSFNIQLRSNAWIAPGLAAFVYIDGVYHCNRSKRAPDIGTPGGSGVEIRLRQREDKMAGPRGQSSGDFVGREWRWVELGVEKPSEDSKMSKELQGNVGEISIVILRCDYDEVQAPQARSHATPAAAASASKASVKARSAQAPSAKAPPAKAPSSKGPSGDAGSTGGLVGLFGLDGTGDSRSTDQQNGYYGQQWDTSTGQHKHNHRSSDKNASAASYQPAEQQAAFPRLDGQDYDHPGVVVNQYGQLHDPRVPYTGYRPNPPNYNPPQPQMYQGSTGPPQGYAPQLGPVPAPQTQQYAGPQPIFVPTYQGQQIPGPQGPQPLGPQYMPNPQMQAYPGQPGQNGPPFGYPSYVGQARAGQNLPQRPPGPPMAIQQQPQFYPPAGPPNYGPPAIDLEYQRYRIFKGGRRYSELFKADLGLIAAAVPHIHLLRNVSIDDLNLAQIEQVRHELQHFMRVRYFPNGEKVRPLGEPFKSSKKPDGGHTGGTSGSKRGGERWHESSSNEEKKQSEWSQGGGWGNSKSGDAQESKSSSSSVSHNFSNNNGSQSGDNQNSGGAAGGGWDNGNAQDAGGGAPAWDDSQKKDENQGQNASWDNSHGGNQNPNNNAQAGPAADTNWGWNDPNNTAPPQDNTFAEPAPLKAPSSRHSTASTSASTINPHAHIKSYFANWRGISQDQPTIPLRHQPREPYAYPAAPAPYVSASQVGDRSHGVRAGRGADYTHKTVRPRYLDTMGEPFAVFIFKYRSAEKLEEILGRNVKEDLKAVADQVGRGVLMGMSKDKLVAEVMKMQESGEAIGGNNGAANNPAAPAAATNTPAGGGTDWAAWGADTKDNANPAQGDNWSGNKGGVNAGFGTQSRKPASNQPHQSQGGRSRVSSAKGANASKANVGDWDLTGKGQTQGAGAAWKPDGPVDQPKGGW